MKKNDITVTDINGNIYKTVKIGNQIWMAENLYVDRFLNGDLIPQAKTDEEWEIAGNNEEPAWCYYYNDPDNGKKYGKLYNRYAVNDPRGLAPKGWNIPSETDFETLLNNVGGSGSNPYYNALIPSGSSGFSALFGGWRGSSGSFYHVGTNGGFWSSSPNYSDYAWSLSIYSYSKLAIIYSFNRSVGFSVRCLQD